VALASSVTHVSAQAPDPFAACSARFAKTPDDYDSAYCFYEVTFQKSLWADGARIFERLIAEQPRNLWLPLAYGHVYRTRDPERAEALYRQAADGFQAVNHAEGELLARSNLRNFLFPKGRSDDAARETARVVEIGRASTDPLLKARAWTLEATQVQDSGGDLSRAYRLLKQTQAAIFPDGPYRLKRSTLNSLGLVAYRLGRFDEALGVFTELDRLAAEQGEGLARANAQYNILNTSMAKENLLPSVDANARLLPLAEKTLATAIAAQNRDMTLKTHRALAELLMVDDSASVRALEHVDACLALARAIRQPNDEAVCSWVKASVLRRSSSAGSAGPAAARAAEIDALAATERAKDPRTQAYSARRRMRQSWETKPRPQAVDDALAAIATVETLRSLQDDADGAAEHFSTWTADYHWLSGHLLQDQKGPVQAAAVDQAFTITERMRARSLLDTLERARSKEDVQHPAVIQRRLLLERLAIVQRKLMDPALAENDRNQMLGTLQDLELQERNARREVDLAFPSRQTAPTAFAGIRDVQATLAPNEALLSYQVGLWKTLGNEFGGGAWLVAITRETTTVHAIPDRAQLAPIVPMFTGLLERADGLDGAPAAKLYHDLLEPALAQLPPGIERLIIVPDGPLHHLPFDALRRERSAPPVAAAYEVVVAPSATLWRHWRTDAPRPGRARALAFADPLLDRRLTHGEAVERNAVLQQGLRLGRLPYARRESAALETHLGGGVDVLVGARASERALKERNLENYRIVHFAVHALADEQRPERSAVLLAPGAATEDGLLQAREIQGLDLDGRIVVLSACQTASGAVLSGEGVLSLARAFFEAGAHAVVGTRWPIRDADASELFDTFYERLGGGAALAGALKAAKVASLEAGRPASTWASLVLLGDGSARPFPEGRPPGTEARRASLQASEILSPRRLLAGSALVAGLILIPLAISSLRRRRPRNSPGTP
jgi:CHAT domain-containing protein